jgi:hypothetical protein
VLGQDVSPASATTFGGATGERRAADGGDLPPRSSRRWLAVAAGGVAAVAVAIGLKVLVAKPGEAARDNPPRASAAATSAAPPTAATPVPPAAAPPAPAAPPPAAPVAPPTVTIDVRGLPAQAALTLDGAPADRVPIQLARDDRRHVLVVRAAGFRDQTLEIDASRNQVVEVAMAALPKPETPRPAPRPARASAPSRKNDASPRAQKAPQNEGHKSSYDDM